MADAYALSERDVQFLKVLAAEYRNKRGGTGKYPPRYDDGYTPDVYIARTPEDGIPALTPDPTGGNLHRPGEAVCTIYKVSIGYPSFTTTTTTTPDPEVTTTTTTTVDPTTTTTSTTPGPSYPELRSTEVIERTVYNLSSVEIPGNCWIIVIRDKYGSWWYISTGMCDGEIDGTTTTSTTTSTTSTTPEPCPGSCLWEWYGGVDGCFWFVVDNDCDEGCNCLYPTICGDDNQCTRTRTPCSSGHNYPPGCDCETATTQDPSTSTTTTTTLSPECAEGCYWKWRYGRWWLEENNCTGDCPCPRPAESGDECQDAFTPCVVPPPPPPPTRCYGQCIWSYNASPSVQDWVLIEYGCNRGTDLQICYCDFPWHIGNDCDLAITICHSHTTTLEPGVDPDPVTTIAPLPGSCTGSCYWRWNIFSISWTLTGTNCVGCSCDSAPSYSGTDECEIAETPCFPATTTTAEPTTTEEPIDVCSSQCSWLWSATDSIWYLESFCYGAGPESSCACQQPPTSGNIDNQREYTQCFNGTTTTTTTEEPTTTTTEEPGCSPLPCWWTWRGSYWEQTNPGICIQPGYASCVCNQPIGPGTFVNETRATSCQGGGFTTSTTTTYTTSEPNCANSTCIYHWDGSNWRFYNCTMPGCVCTGTTSNPAPSSPTFYSFPCAVTTTTTTLDPSLCVWQWNEGTNSWDLIQDPCSGTPPFYCQAPESNGTVDGEIVTFDECSEP